MRKIAPTVNPVPRQKDSESDEGVWVGVRFDALFFDFLMHAPALFPFA
jgi:hypothetical protein